MENLKGKHHRLEQGQEIEDKEHWTHDSLIQPLGRDMTINCLLRLSRSYYGALACTNRRFRSLVRSGYLYELRSQAGISEHWIYLSCSALEWEAFDPGLRRWMRLPQIPQDHCFISSDRQSTSVGTDLFVFGKGFTSPIVLRYSILTNSWSFGRTMNIPRYLFGLNRFGKIAVCAGGIDAQGNVLNCVELYNSETETWVTLPNMNKTRKNCSVAFMDDKLYVTGGIGSKGESYTCGEEYDFGRRNWKIIPDMHPVPCVPTGPPPSHLTVNNELYMADHSEGELRKYHKQNNMWVTLGRLPQRVVSKNGWGFGIRGYGKWIIVVGGASGVLELYSWNTEYGMPLKWELLASRPSGSFVFNFAVMGC